MGLPDLLSLLLPVGLVAAAGEADVLGVPLAPTLDEPPLEVALLEDCAALLLEDCTALLLLAGALLLVLVAVGLLLADALLLAPTVLLALLDEAPRLRAELLPAEK